MKENRDWTVLFIGGASGAGKSSIAYALARRCGVNVLEIDDIVEALKALTTGDTLPATHHWAPGRDWREVGVAGNVDWLIDMSAEIAPALRAVAQDHLETGVPVIIEGDFLSPAFTSSLGGPRVKSLFVHEADKNQIVRNYSAREGGEAQDYRAGISAAYGRWLSGECQKWGVPLLPARPWRTAAGRALAALAMQ